MKKIKNSHILPNSKLAQGHVEMMLSFVLFAGAVLFIFVFINPFAKSVDKSNELDQVQRIIMQSISDNSKRLSIVSYDASGCYHFTSADYPGIPVEIKEIPSSSVDKIKYTIYFSNKFTNPVTPPNNKDTCLDTNYKLGVYSNETIILYDLLKNLATNCNTEAGYQEVKKNLGISMDFTLNITDLDRNAITDFNFAKKASAGVDVQSKEFPIRLINSDGTVKDVIFNIRVW